MDLWIAMPHESAERQDAARRMAQEMPFPARITMNA
jgi:hypothetical protein